MGFADPCVLGAVLLRCSDDTGAGPDKSQWDIKKAAV